MTTTEIKSILENNLPKSVLFNVWEHKNCFGDKSIAFSIYTSNKTINNVQGQYPNIVSYWIYDGYLSAQSFCGNGGGSLYRNIDTNNPAEKYYAMISEKIPVNKTNKNIDKAIKKICIEYVKLLQSFKDRGLLRYGNLDFLN
jgi:hypothetical protein